MRLVFVLIILIPSLSIADGPAIDLQGNPTTECVDLKISAEQQKDISTKRVLILSDTQMAGLSKNWKTKKIGVVSEKWRDCTCGMIYVFWTKTDEVSIPKHLVRYEKLHQDHQNELQELGLESEGWHFLKFLADSIIMDTQGFFYKNGESISITDLREEYKKKDKPLTINIPSLAIMGRKVAESYLKKLSDIGIPFKVFG